jgi:hypothetical protein
MPGLGREPRDVREGTCSLFGQAGQTAVEAGETWRGFGLEFCSKHLEGT